MSSAKVTNYFNSVPTNVWQAQETRKLIILKADEGIEEAIGINKSNAVQVVVDQIRLNEPIVILDDDDIDDDDIVEISKEEAERSLIHSRSYQKRPNNWVTIATYAIENKSVPGAYKKYKSCMNPNSTEDSCLTTIRRWVKAVESDLSSKQRSKDIVNHRKPGPIYGNEIDMLLFEQVMMKRMKMMKILQSIPTLIILTTQPPLLVPIIVILIIVILIIVIVLLVIISQTITLVL